MVEENKETIKPVVTFKKLSFTLPAIMVGMTSNERIRTDIIG